MRSRAVLRMLRAAFTAAALGVLGAAWGACVDPGGVGGTGIDGGTGGTGSPAAAGGAGGTGAPAASGGAGGTGAPMASGGVGGTGIAPEDAPAPGSVGVLGVIEAFGSVCVNGLEIHFDTATPVSVNGRPAAEADLAIGQVVAIVARPGARGLQARRIDVVRALEGPVTRSEPGAQRIFVMGQAVRVSERSTRTGASLRLASLEPGTVVQVSGYRDAGGELVASRIDLAPAGAEHSATGTYLRRDATRGELDGLPVDLGEASATGAGELLVRGRWDGSRLQARSVAIGPSARVIERVERAVVESLVRQPAGERGARIGAYDVRVGPATRIEGDARHLDSDQRVRVSGRPGRNGTIDAERIEIRREGHDRPDGPRRRDGDHRRGGRDDGGRERPDRIDNSGPGRADRPERVDNSGPGRADRPDRLERNERPERVERVDRPEDHSGPH